LRDDTPRIHAAGAELVIVGNGTPEQAADFIDDYAVTTPVYTDPSLGIHRAVGARRGGGGLRLIRNALRALSKGHFQTRVLGDPRQHGGVFVVTQQGEVAYSYLSEVAGDHPDPQAVVRVLERVVEGQDG
jgi:peroxiredoxin